MIRAYKEYAPPARRPGLGGRAHPAKVRRPVSEEER